MTYRLYQAVNEWDAEEIQDITHAFQERYPGAVLTVIDNGKAPQNSIILKFTRANLAQEFDNTIKLCVDTDRINSPVIEEILDAARHFALEGINI